MGEDMASTSEESNQESCPATAGVIPGFAQPDAVNRSECTVQQALDNIGFGRFHIFLFVVCGLGWTSDGSEGAVLGFLLPELRKDFQLTTSQEGNLGSAAALGQVIGALLFGFISDWLGRRPAFITSVTLAGILGTTTALAPNFHAMMALRFLTGIAIGGNLPLAVSMLSECMPES